MILAKGSPQVLVRTMYSYTHSFHVLSRNASQWCNTTWVQCLQWSKLESSIEWFLNVAYQAVHNGEQLWYFWVCGNSLFLWNPAIFVISNIRNQELHSLSFPPPSLSLSFSLRPSSLLPSLSLLTFHHSTLSPSSFLLPSLLSLPSLLLLPSLFSLQRPPCSNRTADVTLFWELCVSTMEPDPLHLHHCSITRIQGLRQWQCWGDGRSSMFV